MIWNEGCVRVAEQAAMSASVSPALIQRSLSASICLCTRRQTTVALRCLTVSVVVHGHEFVGARVPSTTSAPPLSRS